MITSDTLILKLSLQSKLLAKSLNLPEKFGYDLLATAIYQHFNFDELCESVSEFDYVIGFDSLSEIHKLKYLFICEVEDQKLIEDLHIEIEKMAIRLESKTVINISKLDLISNIYKLFGLENESRYIIDAEHIKLDWKPCFESLKDPLSVLCCDVIINDLQVQLLATKIRLDELSVVKTKGALHTNLAQAGDSSAKTNAERREIDKHINWLEDSFNCLSNFDSDLPDQNPEFYNIDNQTYLVYGFILAPYKQNLETQQFENIKFHVKNTHEKQLFILNLEGGKLSIELIYLHRIEDGNKPYLPESQYIQDTILSHLNACSFPVVFNDAYYLMPIRPFAHIDWLENAL